MTLSKIRLLPLAGAALLLLAGCSSPAPSAAPTGSPSPSGSSSYDQQIASWAAEYPLCADRPASTESPIDIRRDALVVDPTATMDLSYTPTVFAVENNGHTIEAVPQDLTANSVTVGGVSYKLQQFHFHASSEHLVDGAGFDAELHLVHKSDDGKTLVIGVFLDTGESNPELAELFSRVPAEVSETPTTTLSKPIDLARVIPAGTPRVQYTGSLTTPPCTEGVHWEVFLNPVTVSAQELSAFTAVYPDNHRPVQPLHGRQLTEDPNG